MSRMVRRLTISVHGRLIDGVRAINRGGHGIAFVCDDHDRVIGTLTDGDVRRAILEGAALDSRCLRTVMRREFTSATPDEGRADVLDAMRSQDISQIPVLDRKGRLIGVHLLRELLGAVDRENCAVIMAGGQGTRLRPLTEQVPKPMLTVAGRPILERLVLHLVGWGVKRIFISVGYLSHMIEEYFGDGTRFGCHIRYLRETSPRGTGGSLALLPPLRQAPLIVLNGDLVTQVNLDRLLTRHVQSGAAATICVRPYTVRVPYGVIETRNRRVAHLREKPTYHMLVNAGIYVLSTRIVRMVPRRKSFPITDLLQQGLDRGLRVSVYELEDEWVDVGGHDDLLRARGVV